MNLFSLELLINNLCDAKAKGLKHSEIKANIQGGDPQEGSSDAIRK
jgi:hypothetical protein